MLPGGWREHEHSKLGQCKGTGNTKMAQTEREVGTLVATAAMLGWRVAAHLLWLMSGIPRKSLALWRETSLALYLESQSSHFLRKDLMKKSDTFISPLPPPQGSPGESELGRIWKLRVTSFSRPFRNERKGYWRRLGMNMPPCMEPILALLLVSTVSGSSWVTLLPWTSSPHLSNGAPSRYCLYPSKWLELGPMHSVWHPAANNQIIEPLPNFLTRSQTPHRSMTTLVSIPALLLVPTL